MFNIDGSQLEGGGQILRISSALSIITSTPIHISNIRAGRSKPGLASQHMSGLQLLSNLIDSPFQGLTLRSTTISIPLLDAKPTNTGLYSIDIVTAGSISLILQSAIPVVLFSKQTLLQLTTDITVQGGTDVDFSPPIDYFIYLLFPMLKKLFNIEIESTIQRRGFNPKGGGVVLTKINPLSIGEFIPCIDLSDPGELLSITIYTFSSGKKYSGSCDFMIEKIREGVEAFKSGVSIFIGENNELSDTESNGDGIGLTLIARSTSGCTWGSSRSSNRMTRASLLKEVLDEILSCIRSGAVVDEYAEDQLIIFLALAKGLSRIRIPRKLSLHTQTAIAIAEQLTGAKFTLHADGFLSCTGIARTNERCWPRSSNCSTKKRTIEEIL